MKVQHVLITGSTRGIGFGLAHYFASRGLHVTLNGTTDQSVAQALEKLRNSLQYPLVQGFKGNTGSPEDMENILRQAIACFGPVHLWINNAGIDHTRVPAWEIPVEEADRIIQTNISGVVNGSRTAFRHMVSQGEGLIYNMEGFGSDGMILQGMSLYGTTKRAVRYFTRALAIEAEGTGVMVGTLSPGMVITEMITSRLDQNPEENPKTRRIFNILGDKVETVAPFLGQKALKTTRNNNRIAWLTKGKIIWRFLRSPFYSRKLV